MRFPAFLSQSGLARAVIAKAQGDGVSLELVRN